MQSTSQKTLDKYLILKTLGSGGTCKVKLGYDTVENKKVAIKILKDTLSESTMKLVLEEVKTMQTLSHENILE